LWERRRTLMLSLLGGVALAALLAAALPAKYQATARVLPGEANPVSRLLSGGGPALADTGPVAELMGGRTAGGLFAAAVHSDAVEDALIGRFGLCAVYHVRGYERARARLADSIVL